MSPRTSALTSGCGIFLPRQSKRNRSSSSRRVRVEPSACSSKSVRSTPVPRRPGWRPSTARSSDSPHNPNLSASSAARSSCRCVTPVDARSRRVRAGEVTGIPSRSKSSEGGSPRGRCTLMPLRHRRPVRVGAMTSTGPCLGLSSRHSSAAETWLSTDPSQAKTAAIQIPRLVWLPLSEYTPRWTRRSHPASTQVRTAVRETSGICATEMTPCCRLAISTMRRAAAIPRCWSVCGRITDVRRPAVAPRPPSRSPVGLLGHDNHKATESQCGRSRCSHQPGFPRAAARIEPLR